MPSARFADEFRSTAAVTRSSYHAIYYEYIPDINDLHAKSAHSFRRINGGFKSLIQAKAW
jgi:hypothetical protein